MKPDWCIAIFLIDREQQTLEVYDARGVLIEQGRGRYRWRPNHDPGDEHADPDPELPPLKIRFA